MLTSPGQAWSIPKVILYKRVTLLYMYQDPQTQQNKIKREAIRTFRTSIHLQYEGLFYMIQHLHIVIVLHNVKGCMSHRLTHQGNILDILGM